MNCQRFESVAVELARGQMMGAEVRNEALAHSAACQTCATRLRTEEMLTRGFRSVFEEMTAIEAPAAIEANLLKAFRQPQVATVTLVGNSTPNYRRYWLTAIAALLLIVFSVIAVRWRTEKVVVPQNARNQTTPQKNEAVPQQSPEVRPEETLASDPHQPRPQRPKRRVNSSALTVASAQSNRDKGNDANHASYEVATEFMPLGYLNPVAFQDGGQIVRVEVPRTTLANFGIPVNMDRYNERVKADILVGVDGTARAIRFVQDKRLQ